MNRIEQPGEPQAPAGQEIVKPPPAADTAATVQPTATVKSPSAVQSAATTESAAEPRTLVQPRPDLAAMVFAERARRAADGVLAKAQRGLERTTGKADRLRAKQARLRTRARHRAADHVWHPDGGRDTAERLESASAILRDQISEENANGSRKHQRLPGWLKHVPKLVLLVDFILLVYFFSGVTNVDWASPMSVSLGFAALLGVMVTTLSFGFLAFTGYRLRSYKDHAGAIAHRELDGLTRAACGAAACGAIVIAVLMFVRMRAETLDALGTAGWVTADVIALVLAVVSLLANFLVLLIHALDGSDEVAKLDAIWATARRPLGKAHRMRERAAIIAHRVAVQQRRGDRQAVRAISQHDRVAGYPSLASRPTGDFRPLRTALEHLGSPLPEVPSERDEQAS
jgi:hypothetical protein